MVGQPGPDSTARSLGEAADGDLQRAQVQIQDLQRALRESNTRHHDLVENAPYVVLVLDLDGRVLYANPAAERLTGYDALALLTRKLRDIVALQSQDDFDHWLEEAQRTEAAESLLGVMTSAGEQRTLHFSCSRRDDSAAGGPVLRVIGYDTTERMRWMELQRALFVSVKEPILATAPDGQIVLFNPAASELFQAGLMGRRINQVIPFVDDPAEWLQEGLRWQGRLPAADDRTLDIEVTASLMADPTQPIQAVYVLHDVSRQAELVREREQLLHNVAHELRNPISIVENILSILASDVGELPVKDLEGLLKTAYRTATRLHELTEDLLSAGNIQAGHFQVAPRPVPLAQLIEDSLESVQPLLDATRQCVTTHTPKGAVTVQADQPYVVRVLANLLANASKYSPNGTTIRLTGELLADGVRISVRDQGPGIPAHEQQGIFERFYRGRPAHDQPGVGLGLAIAKGIVEAHGGTIGLESPPHQGATFWFTLPLAEPAG